MNVTKCELAKGWSSGWSGRSSDDLSKYLSRWEGNAGYQDGLTGSILLPGICSLEIRIICPKLHTLNTSSLHHFWPPWESIQEEKTRTTTVKYAREIKVPVRQSSAQPFLICFIFLLQHSCWPHQAYPTQWPPRGYSIPILTNQRHRNLFHRQAGDRHRHTATLTAY